jgi:hypothetical protein
VRQPTGRFHELSHGSAAWLFQQFEHLFRLGPSRTPSAFAGLAFLGGLAPFLAGVAFLFALALDGATRAFRGAALGFVVAFGPLAVAVAWAISWVSVVDVVIGILLAVDYRVTTWIALVWDRSKAILL